MIGVIIGLFSGIFIFLLAAFVSWQRSSAFPTAMHPGGVSPNSIPAAAKTASGISWCPRVHVASRPANFKSQRSRWSS